MPDILPGDLTKTDVLDLLQAHADLMLSLSPPGSCHFLPAEGLARDDVTFWEMREAGELVGCGALQALSDHEGEIKSMHICEDVRGRGLSRRMLEHILEEAHRREYARVSLETGSMDGFLPARRLYEAYGFTYCGPFGSYVEDPNSTYMTLDLDKSGLS